MCGRIGSCLYLNCGVELSFRPAHEFSSSQVLTSPRTRQVSAHSHAMETLLRYLVREAHCFGPCNNYRNCRTLHALRGRQSRQRRSLDWQRDPARACATTLWVVVSFLVIKKKKWHTKTPTSLRVFFACLLVFGGDLVIQEHFCDPVLMPLIAPQLKVCMLMPLCQCTGVVRSSV